MRKFKFLDTWINIILSLAGIIFAFIFSDKIFIVYFVIGSWQCISMGVHHYKRWFMEENAIRRLFHQIVIGVFFISLSAGLISFFSSSFLFLLIVMMLLYVTAPILALTYTCICYNETYIKMRRPLSLLK